ncbi:nucleotide sugar dehydrogenase [Halorhodospira sp. 9622]|uniref:nucleotide sugar dehydrogenase n=1 Tax=Halorhodospira sp. 9622 TaxID=2899136 RepID=UPI001EE97FFC|nr:nucleotide sugar dehydrogenase [Halorhodospira sp. 9622]MCG5539095.1 nucleotide sugar dehydrogenase [Halorhodospira sp. 9622]
MSSTKVQGKSRRHYSTVGIVGLGYVGLPLMLRFMEEGFRVIGFDVDPDTVATLNSGKSQIAHISHERVEIACRQGFEATTDPARSGEVDALILCLPTPLNRHREPDLSYVLETATTFAPYLHAGQLVALESTTYPGTTEEELLPILESGSGLTVGDTLFLAYSPEREDPANPNFTTRTIPKVCGGVTQACLDAGVALYSAIIDEVVPMSSPRAAEMTKLLENIHRAVNIGLVNEMKIVADRMGIDIYEVINAAATKPFGFVPYYPGPGLGGHCIPIDPFYLTWKARAYGLNTRFIELAGEINTDMPRWVITKLADALNDRGKPIRGSRILVLGIAYKKNVDDMRESPSVAMMELLRDKGAELSYCDPHVPRFPKMRNHHFDLETTHLTPETLQGADAVLLATDHDAFDYDLLREHAPLIIDTRGVFSGHYPHIVRA